MSQIAKKVTRVMRKIMMNFGHFEGQKTKLLAKFYVLLTFIFIANTIFDIYSLESEQFEEKIFRFKNFNMLICALSFPLVHKDTYRLISHFEDPISNKFVLHSSKERALLKEKLDAELDQINKVLYTVTITSVLTLTFGPLVVAICKIYESLLFSGDQISVKDVTLPISFWYPQKYSNFVSYFLLYALQVFYMYMFCGYMYCTITSGLMALRVTIYDVRVLCLTVKEWDRHSILDNDEKLDDLERFETNQLYRSGSESNKLLLKDFLFNVIEMHEQICRKASSLDKSLENLYTVLNNAICFQICVCLYSSAKMEDIALKVEHILLVIPLASILFLYCINAQELLNQGENFRKTLWESSFFEKPKWYKSCFLIILTRNMKDLEIKPFGFYVLNLKTFATVMNAAYSYFNMLNSLNKRK